MKLRPEEMAVFDLNYGDLLRPDFRILPNRGWGQCSNLTTEHLIVYGPKHQNERSIFDTSPYILPPGATTPDKWDCDGFFLPADRSVRRWRRMVKGPVAVKFRNYRRFWVREEQAGVYRCPWDNGVFEPSEINWAIPSLSYHDVALRIRIC
jgi:hypothetical protein